MKNAAMLFMTFDFLIDLLQQQMQAIFRIGKGERPPIPDFLSRDAKDLSCSAFKLIPMIVLLLLNS